MSKQSASKQAREVGAADANAVAAERQRLAELQERRVQLEGRLAEISGERMSLAHRIEVMRDAAAIERRDQLDAEAQGAERAIGSIKAAEVVQARLVADAETAEAKAVQTEHAQAIRCEWAEAERDFVNFDEGFGSAVARVCRIYERFERMQQHGYHPPAQQTLMFVDVVVTFLMQLPEPIWRQLNFLGLDHLPPGRRRAAMSLYRGSWSLQVEHQAAAIGGEQQEQTAVKPEAA